MVWIILISNISLAQPPNFTLLEQHNFKLLQRGLLKPTQELTSIKRVSAPADAIASAVADISKLPESERIFYRYVWVPDNDVAKFAAVNFTTSHTTAIKSTSIPKMEIVQKSLIRYDLRRLVQNEQQLANLIILWEKLANEPYFHINRKLIDAVPTGIAVISSAPQDPLGSLRFTKDNNLFFKSNTGATFIFRNNQWAKTNIQFNIDPNTTVSTYGAHVGLQTGVMLQGLTQSNAAVVRYDYYIKRLLTTLAGGLYYEAVGIQRNPQHRSAQDQFLIDFAGITEADVAKLRSDQRAAIFQSHVTGKPRRIDILQGIGVRPGVGQGLVTITHDPFDEDIDPAFDPIRNLLNLKDRAREVILEMPNGMHIFALFDEKGALQDFVPPNVASDRTIPSPYTTQLQPGISCIRCHGPHDGLQPFNNDVRDLLNGPLNAYDDLNSNKSQIENIDRLAGLYSGDFTKPIRRGRDDYSDATYIATSGMSNPDTSSTIATIFSSYQYELIDAKRALYEIGYEVNRDEAIQLLRNLIPSLPADEIGIRPEDPVLEALKLGIPVTRTQFENVYPDLAFRAWKTISDQNRSQK